MSSRSFSPGEQRHDGSMSATKPFETALTGEYKPADSHRE